MDYAIQKMFAAWDSSSACAETRHARFSGKRLIGIKTDYSVIFVFSDLRDQAGKGCIQYYCRGNVC